jgi:hypothetical protein
MLCVLEVGLLTEPQTPIAPIVACTHCPITHAIIAAPGKQCLNM